MKQKGGSLLGIILLGFILRCINLGSKPLWLDEIITGLFTFGQGYQVIPKETVFPIEIIPSLFTYQAKSYSEIAHFLAEESTHPPLFFCLMHQWLGGIQTLSFLEIPLAVQLRSLSVILGVVAIFLLYQLNRSAFFEGAGVLGAIIMAVSPFAVYLAQEARQYTLLLILIILALFALMQLIHSTRDSLFYWLLWGTANSLGGYTHYFFILSFVAQISILVLFFLDKSPRRLLLVLAVTLGIFLAYIPWLPTLINHLSSSKTDWLPDADLVSPIYQLILGFLVMVVTFPVENQSVLVQVISGSLMLGLGGWLLFQVSVGYRELLSHPKTRKVTLALSLYLGLVLIQFLGIIYVLDKNIAIAPRYNYIFYPAICALLGASLASDQSSFPKLRKRATWGVILMGLISSFFVVSNLFFLKPYLPEITAERFNQSSRPILIAMGYQDQMDLALGLSYGLALNHLQSHSSANQFIFLDRKDGYEAIWDKIGKLDLNIDEIWVIGTGLKKVAFPEKLAFNSQQGLCHRDRANYYRIGIPYQRYQCKSSDF